MSISRSMRRYLKEERTRSMINTLLIAIAIICLILCCQCSGRGTSDTPQDTSSDTGTDSGIPPATDVSEVPETDSPDTAQSGTVFYVDPLIGSMDNDGSAAHPWRTLQEVVEQELICTRVYETLPYTEGGAMKVKNPDAPVKPGDTIVLRNGHHGRFWIRGAYNDPPITIRAETGHTPTLSLVFLSAASGWCIEGLIVSPQTAAVYEPSTLVQLESHSWHGPSSNIAVTGCTLYSMTDTSAWSMEDWNNLSCNAITADGHDMLIEDNLCRNVNFGISVTGDNCVVRHNTIENFAGDGMRGLGDDLLFEYNTVKNCYAVNANHDDGFQSWAIDGDPPERVVLRGNTIINYEDPGQPFRGALQGIGCFDGPYVDWVIENNVVIVDHWHGISIYNGYNCRVVNNTVADINSERPGPPWILINPHKDGTPSEGCIVRNNIAPQVIVTDGAVEDHNYTTVDYDDTFINYSGFDLRIAPGSPPVDAGTADLAPPIDISGAARPLGGGFDIGAYEQ